MRISLPAVAVVLAASLGACSSTTALTIHNGTQGPVRIEGLPGGPVNIAAAEDRRVEGVTAHLKLKALRLDSTPIEEATIALPPPGGESVWSVGGTACFAEGDYSGYYGPADLPAAIRLVGLHKPGERVYQSKGPLAAGPGQRLPARAGAGAVHALVRIPCEAAANDAVARSWLEMVLPQMEP